MIGVMATSNGEVQHSVQFTTADPRELTDAVAAAVAGTAAAQQQQDYLMANAASGHAGELAGAASTQQPDPAAKVSTT